jgi:hypothetical protein
MYGGDGMRDLLALADTKLETEPTIERQGPAKIYRLTPDLEKIIIEYEAKSASQGSLPLVYDHSMYSSMQSCPRKGFLNYVMHLKPTKARQHPLTFGTAIHAGLESVYLECTTAKMEGRPIPAYDVLKAKALRKYVESAVLDRSLPKFIKDEAKYKPHSVERGYNLVMKYIEERPYDNDLWVVERPEDCEVGFAIMIAGFIFVGRIDLLVRLKRNKKLCIVDHKTTTKMTEIYGSQWNPNNALSGYMDAASELKGEKCRQAMINCLYFNKNIEDVDHIFPTTRSDRDIEDWREEVVETMKWIQGMYDGWKVGASTHLVTPVEPIQGAGEAAEFGKVVDTEVDMSLGSRAINKFPKNTSHCLAYFRECIFMNICCSANPHMRDKIAAADFEVRQWLPFEELSNKGLGD